MEDAKIGRDRRCRRRAATCAIGLTLRTMLARVFPALLLLMGACSKVPEMRIPPPDRPVRLAGEGVHDLGALLGAKATLLVSLDPECPVTRLYAPVLDSLARVLVDEGMAMVGFHPSPFTSDEAVAAFRQQVLPALPHVVDTDCDLASALGCRVMPEVFLFDAQGRLRYRGAIDDRVARAGRKKPFPTRHHLAEALDAVRVGRPVAEAHVPAKGCVVECDRTWEVAVP